MSDEKPWRHPDIPTAKLDAAFHAGRSLHDVIPELTPREAYALGFERGTSDLLQVLDAAEAYRDLNACLRIGRNPSDGLMKRIDAARELIERMNR